jgi:Bacterial Ig-like domain (group 1)
LLTLPVARNFSLTKSFLVISIFAILAACGGGGAKAPDTGTGGTPTGGGVGNIPGTASGTTNTATGLQLLVSNQTMPSAGGQTVDITVVALNASGRALTDKEILVSVTDPVTTGKVFTTTFPTDNKTGSDGTLTGKLNLGTSKQNRTVTITATADGISSDNTVDVSGTEITLSGTTSLVLNQSTTVTISLKDSAGNPIQGAPVTITSKNGNEFRDLSGNLLTTAPVTNRSGQVVVNVKAINSGADVVTASTLGATGTSNLSISGSSFAFVQPSPATDTNVAVNTAQQIRLRWVEGSVPQNGQVITLSSTRGTITPASGNVTNAQGELTATIQSSSAGEAIVQASAAGGTPSTTLRFVFVTTSASSVNVQADRTTVAVNTSGADTNRATVTAIVRDSANNLVKDARVQFQIAQDVTGGRLSGTEDITDVSGSATVDYIAGTTSSSNQGVVIKATVVDVGGSVPAVQPAGLSNTVNLTVGGQSLFVRLATDNKVSTLAPNFTKLFSALVTDAAGNPVPGARVQFEIKPAQPPIPAYQKGAYFVSNAAWRKVYDDAVCFNEDLNLNGVLDALVSEDLNYNGKLDAGEDQNINNIVDLRAPFNFDIGNTGVALKSEDIRHVNGILDPSEDVNGNFVLDSGEDTDADGILDPKEDLNNDNILDPGEDTRLNVPPNGILDDDEDIFRNGILDLNEKNPTTDETLHQNGFNDANEDFNLDGNLTPGNVATATSNILTDALGFATTTVAYSQDFATWATVTLTAKVSVAGSETTSSVTFTLPGLAADYTTITAEPPGRISPFGQRRNCSSRF